MVEKSDKPEKVSTTLSTSYSVKPLTQSDKWNIVKQFLLIFGLSLVVVVAVFLFSFFIIDVFPDYVPISTADTLLEIMIQTNGILLGFVGIIFAQMLSSVISQQTTLYNKIIENPEKATNAEESVWTNQEAGYMLGKNAKVVPLIVEETNIKEFGFLKALQGIHVKEENLEVTFKEILKIVET